MARPEVESRLPKAPASPLREFLQLEKAALVVARAERVSIREVFIIFFGDTFIPIFFFWIIKINNFRVDLSDILAKQSSLVCIPVVCQK